MPGGRQECLPHRQSQSLPHRQTPGDAIRKLFDCVLVDEYQDTNILQAEILYRLSPQGKGLTVVGDDAQSIYAFRAATVRNILDFPKQYPNATIVTLEQNYRSTQPILDATNGVIGLARERYAKNLWSERADGERPCLVNCEDDTDQAEYIIRKILEHREAGVDLRRQAVLFRASHHSILLEAELARAKIPFHKYGGLKFVEARARERPDGVPAAGRKPPRHGLRLASVAAAARHRSRQGAAAYGHAAGGRRQFRRLGRVASARRGYKNLAEVRQTAHRLDRHPRRPADASRPHSQVLRAASGGQVRPRRAALARPGSNWS